MAMKYKIKRPEAVDALAVSGISTAKGLAESAGISRGTAQAVFRGDEVTLQVAVGIVQMLQGEGAEVALSTIFEEARP